VTNRWAFSRCTGN